MKYALVAFGLSLITYPGYGKFSKRCGAENPGFTIRHLPCDTQRVHPKLIALPEVSVQRPGLVALRSTGPRPQEFPGARLVPGIQCASYFGNADTAATIMEVRIRFHASQPTAGRVRIQLVAAVGGLLPAAKPVSLARQELTYSATQLAALPDHLLKIELLPEAIQFPAAGLYVLIEGLPTQPSECCVELTPEGNILTKDTTNLPSTLTKTPVRSYPAIPLITSTTSARTMMRNAAAGNAWRARDHNDNTNRAENPDITVVCLPR